MILADPSARADDTSEHSMRSSCSFSSPRLPEYKACSHACNAPQLCMPRGLPIAEEALSDTPERKFLQLGPYMPRGDCGIGIITWSRATEAPIAVDRTTEHFSL